MGDAIKELHDYLVESPSVVYPQDVLEYLPAIEAENAKLKEELEAVGTAAYLYGRSDLKIENAKLRDLCKDWRRFAYDLFDEFVGEPEANDVFMALEDRMSELGVEL